MTAEVPMKIDEMHDVKQYDQISMACKSMDIHAKYTYPWITMDIHGHPWTGVYMKCELSATYLFVGLASVLGVYFLLLFSKRNNIVEI